VNFGLLIFGGLDRRRLAAALGELVSLPAEAVDVGDEGEDERNWAAPVSCTVTELRGDLHWSLDIYIVETVSDQPTVAGAAALVAQRLGTVVGYESVPYPPSAYWLVGPDGRRTRARIFEHDGGFRIDAVEHPLAALPGLPVAPIPEVIHSYRMPTPIADRLRAAVGDLEAVRLLEAWEAMTVRLSEGWPPDGWYPADYYRQDLRTRDELAAAVEVLPAATKDVVARAVGEVDRRFAGATGGSPGRDRWWWQREPDPLPWRGEPGAG
jgi:hypothetical protein